MKTRSGVAALLAGALLAGAIPSGRGADYRFELEEWATVEIGGNKVKIYGQPILLDFGGGGFAFKDWAVSKDGKTLSVLVELKGVKYRGKTVDIATYDKDDVRIGKKGLFELNDMKVGEKIRLSLKMRDPDAVRSIKLARDP